MLLLHITPVFLLRSLSFLPFLSDIVCFPSDFVCPPSFTFSFFIITGISFPLTRSDYTQSSLAITFYFKSTQPPDLPCFRLLFGSAVVIKMLPGSWSLLSKVSFLLHRAMCHSNSAFLPLHSPSTLIFCYSLIYIFF